MYNTIKNLSPAFIVVTALFFGWGFISANNEPLLTALKSVFHLTWTEALLTQITGFVANALIAFPAAAMLSRLGSSRAILIALGAMLLACLAIQLDIVTHNYLAILIALFLMALGVSTLQVAANPLIAVLGPEDDSHFRLTLAQTFNSLGVVIGVHFGRKILLPDEILQLNQNMAQNLPNHFENMDHKMRALDAVSMGYLAIGVLILCMIILIFMNRKQIDEASKVLQKDQEQDIISALKSKWAIMGALAIGLYVGAEVSIASIMISFLGQSNILNLSLEKAGAYLANFYWGGALFGRFIGTALLTKFRAPFLLAICASAATISCLIVIFSSGPIAGFFALLVGIFNSIMFPVIFTITLRRANVGQASVSGLLCLSISGGALLVLLVGRIADFQGLSISFAIPMLAYAFISFFAYLAIKTLKPKTEN